MPDLPTVTLTQSQFDRVVAAFPGKTLAEKASAYKAWLVMHLIDYVKTTELAGFEADLRTQLDAKVDELEASLPPRPQFPPGGIS